MQLAHSLMHAVFASSSVAVDSGDKGHWPLLDAEQSPSFSAVTPQNPVRHPLVPMLDAMRRGGSSSASRRALAVLAPPPPWARSVRYVSP